MNSLLIIGAGGHGKVVADTAIASGYVDVAFLDKDWPQKTKIATWNIIGKPEISAPPMFCAVGNNITRERLFADFKLQTAPVLKHPSAIISPSTHIGEGTILVAGTIVNADTHIGRGVILNTACSIDHDCIIECFSHISPGARLAGGVRVGKRSWIGIGAVVREGIHIGDDVIVGAGSVVLQDIKSGTKVYGVPARSIG